MEKHFISVYKRLKKRKFDKNILCREYWFKIERMKANFDESKCWDFFFDNIEWLINSGVITTDDIVTWFTEEELDAHNIFSSGTHDIKDKKAIAIKNAEIKATGHSRIIAFDRAKIIGFDSTFVTGFNFSEITVTDCMAYGAHECKIFAKGYSKVEAFDQVSVKASGYSYVILADQAKESSGNNVYMVKK